MSPPILNDEDQDEVKELNMNMTEKSLVLWMTFSPNRIVAFILAVIFGAELLIMFCLDYINIQNKTLEAFVDSGSLTLLTTLIFWKTIFAPFRRVASFRDSKARREIHESKALAKTLFVNSPFGIGEIDRFGKILHVNGKFAELLGSAPHQLRKLPLSEVFDENGNSSMLGEFKRVVGEGLTSSNHQKVLRISGQTRFLDISFYALRGLNGDVDGVLCILLEDISNSKKTAI